MKLDALIAFTQASYRTLQVSLLNMIKINKRIGILKIHSSSIFFIQLHVVCLTFEICLRRFFIFLTSEARFSAL